MSMAAPACVRETKPCIYQETRTRDGTLEVRTALHLLPTRVAAKTQTISKADAWVLEARMWPGQRKGVAGAVSNHEGGGQHV